MFTGLKSHNILPIKVFYSGLALAGIGLVCLLIWLPYIPSNVSLKEGDTAPRTILSPKHVEFESSLDKEKTKQYKADHQALIVDKIFTVDEAINKEILSNIHQIFRLVKLYKQEAHSHPFAPPPDTLRMFSESQLDSFVKMDARSLGILESFSRQSAEELLEQGMQTVGTTNVASYLTKNSQSWELNSLHRELAFTIIIKFLRPNLIYDETKTKTLEKELSSSVKPSTTVIRQGTPIIFEGDTVTKQHLEIFQVLGMTGIQIQWKILVGIILITILLMTLLERFLYYFNPRIHAHLSYIVLTYLLMLAVMLNALAFYYLPQLPFGIEPYFLIPIPIAAMLVSLLLRTNISMLSGSILSILIALMFKMDFSVFIFLFLSNCVALFAAYKKYSRKELLYSGYIVGLFNGVIVVALGCLKEQTSLAWYLSNGSIAFLNGVVSAMVALASLPYFETVFNITTRQTLLELSNLNHPLMKRLMMTAPGTYQHSLMVANLAEAAAEAIHADPILARVGAYFHDIGKTKRPLFFTENQFSGENPHNNLTPRMSKIIISSHTKDGVELATKYKLPQVLKDIMLEHHGTTMVSFFYTQALQSEDIKDAESAKEEFRYPGPKPHFKESGIIMLADSIEATSRSLEKPTLSKLEALVDKITKEKIEDQQLDDCPLSLKEIDEIKDAFMRIFKGMYHNRVDYQEELDKMMEQHKLP